MVSNLKHEIDKFKAWADIYLEETRSAEWECDYSDWSSLYDAFNELISTKAPSDLSEDDIDNIIFSIARDNKIEELISYLAENVDMFTYLLSYVVKSSESNAKWQFAVTLGCEDAFSGVAEEVLLQLVSDPDEYTSRMALQSLGRIKSPHAQQYCIKAWGSNHEYQRMMSLWVLKYIGSSLLPKYIELGISDGRKYLVQKAIELKNA